MLQQDIVEKLARELKMAPLNIIRENLEMETLNELTKHDLSKNLIFYGGTALRLAYNSARFSEDLDFLLVRKSAKNAAELKEALAAVAKDNPGVMVEEVRDKRLTLFGLLKISHLLLKHPIRIKIEMCKKQNGVRKENKLLISPTSNLEIVFPTADGESIYKTKLEALESRGLPRDWYDIWYLEQKFKKDNANPKRKFDLSAKEFANELKRFLPKDRWPLVDQAKKHYAP